MHIEDAPDFDSDNWNHPKDDHLTVIVNLTHDRVSKTKQPSQLYKTRSVPAPSSASTVAEVKTKQVMLQKAKAQMARMEMSLRALRARTTRRHIAAAGAGVVVLGLMVASFDVILQPSVAVGIKRNLVALDVASEVPPVHLNPPREDYGATRHPTKMAGGVSLSQVSDELPAGMQPVSSSDGNTASAPPAHPAAASASADTTGTCPISFPKK